MTSESKILILAFWKLSKWSELWLKQELNSNGKQDYFFIPHCCMCNSVQLFDPFLLDLQLDQINSTEGNYCYYYSWFICHAGIECQIYCIVGYNTALFYAFYYYTQNECSIIKKHHSNECEHAQKLMGLLSMTRMHACS